MPLACACAYGYARERVCACVYLRLLEVHQNREFLGREKVVVNPCVIVPSGHIHVHVCILHTQEYK